MGKHKAYCWACQDRHFPPTGKKCQNLEHLNSNDDQGPQNKKVAKTKSGGTRDSQLNKVFASVSTHNRTPSVTHEMDSYVKRVSNPGHSDQSDSDEGGVSTGEGTGSVQNRILAELQKMNVRLDMVESQVAGASGATGSSNQENQDSKLSKTVKSKKCQKSVKIRTVSSESSDSSSEEDEIPSLSELRVSKKIQKQIDQKIAQLGKCQKEGNEQSEKIKSQRGGPVDVVVRHKVPWPHEHILGGPTRQRVTYDNLSLTQFIQGFVKNVLDEPCQKSKEKMLHYLGDLMEDATDFSWANAKAAHAVLLCEMERGALTWADTSRIERIRRAHAQKHSTSKPNWAKNQENKRPWFCKQYQSGNCNFFKDHEVSGRLHKHICAFCLAQGRQLTHAEKDCNFAKRNGPKNDRGAAQQ